MEISRFFQFGCFILGLVSVWFITDDGLEIFGSFSSVWFVDDEVFSDWMLNGNARLLVLVFNDGIDVDF